MDEGKESEQWINRKALSLLGGEAPTITSRQRRWLENRSLGCVVASRLLTIGTAARVTAVNAKERKSTADRGREAAGGVPRAENWFAGAGPMSVSH